MERTSSICIKNPHSSSSRFTRSIRHGTPKFVEPSFTTSSSSQRWSCSRRSERGMNAGMVDDANNVACGTDTLARADFLRPKGKKVGLLDVACRIGLLMAAIGCTRESCATLLNCFETWLLADCVRISRDERSVCRKCSCHT